MGILTHLDVLAKECENMRTFIETGFGDGHEYAGEQRSKIERSVVPAPSVIGMAFRA
jgi:hypothetical protein